MGEALCRPAPAASLRRRDGRSPEPRTHGRRDDELDALIALLRSLRDRIPPDLQQRLVAALRELLEAIRALLDWYLERLERPRREPTEVQDIPIL